MYDADWEHEPAPSLHSPLLEICELFKRPTDDRLGVQPHPVLQNGAIQAPEVMVGDDVTLLQILGLHGGELAVLPTLDWLAQDKGYPTRAMVGARAVVTRATAKFRKHQHDHVVADAMLFQVIEEAGDTLGDVSPQLVVHTVLVGVAIEAAVVTVEDARAKIGHVHLSNTLQLLGNGRLRVLHGRRVHLWSILQDVGTLQGIKACLT